jgi:hypothetical protein
MRRPAAVGKQKSTLCSRRITRYAAASSRLSANAAMVIRRRASSASRGRLTWFRLEEDYAGPGQIFQTNAKYCANFGKVP